MPEKVSALEQIPFLPIEFFKSHQILTGHQTPELLFESSGTTGSVPSRHFVVDPDLYLGLSKRIFETHFGKLDEFVFLALLPSYLERKHSSLVFMMNEFIRASGSPYSGFYLDNFDELKSVIHSEKLRHKKVMLWGVTFALLDFAKSCGPLPDHVCVMETGGMKGRREEMIREEVHDELMKAFKKDAILSEYGMTELLSQCYALKDGLFKSPPWFRVQIREGNDPLNTGLINESGGINIIDLANIHSCSFIATQDLGRMKEDGTFEVLGRFDHSDVRGCSLMAL
jgi:hypothetical protein